jgi:hypothetical protein
MPDDLEVRKETVRIGHKQYELTVRQQSMFVWLADGNSEGEALEGRGPCSICAWAVRMNLPVSSQSGTASGSESIFGSGVMTSSSVIASVLRSWRRSHEASGMWCMSRARPDASGAAATARLRAGVSGLTATGPGTTAARASHPEPSPRHRCSTAEGDPPVSPAPAHPIADRMRPGDDAMLERRAPRADDAG